MTRRFLPALLLVATVACSQTPDQTAPDIPKLDFEKFTLADRKSVV